MAESNRTPAERASAQPDGTGDLLVARAAQIDPRLATCFNGYYGEDFKLEDGSVQRVVSSALIWTDGQDGLPDWAMREAWPDFRPDWERLQTAAWERNHRHNGPSLASPQVDAILQLEPTPFELIDALYRVFAAERTDQPL